ncbi:hypothetical protein N7470_001078 [Penicillium chermesinum]|nr:hypothetical protein N7470_001078 [Penicillium chermesinum]
MRVRACGSALNSLSTPSTPRIADISNSLPILHLSTHIYLIAPPRVHDITECCVSAAGAAHPTERCVKYSSPNEQVRQHLSIPRTKPKSQPLLINLDVVSPISGTAKTYTVITARLSTILSPPRPTAQTCTRSPVFHHHRQSLHLRQSRLYWHRNRRPARSLPLLHSVSAAPLMSLRGAFRSGDLGSWLAVRPPRAARPFRIGAKRAGST